MNILEYRHTLIEDGDADVIGAMGRYHPRKQLLQVAEGLPPDQRTSTVIHEIIEALNFLLDIGLEENQKMNLESGLFQVFKANAVDLSPLLAELDDSIKETT